MSFADALINENNLTFEAAPPLDDMLDGTCTYERMATGVDSERGGFGNLPITAVTKATNLPCSIQPKTSFSRFEELYQTKQAVKYDYIGYIKVRADNIDIDFTPTARDRITSYSKDGVDQGLVYNVSAVLNDGGGTKHWFLGLNTVDK